MPLDGAGTSGLGAAARRDGRPVRGVPWTGRRSQGDTESGEDVGGRGEHVLRTVPSAAGGGGRDDQVERGLERAPSASVSGSERVLPQERRGAFLSDVSR